MYCRFCGHEILDQAKFCGFCGRSQENRPSRSSNLYPILCFIAGALLVLGGLLPFFIDVGTEDYVRFLNRQHFSGVEQSAVSCLQNFLTVLSPLFHFFSSALSVYSGILLLKRETQQSAPVLLLPIAHGASILYFAITNLLIYCAPGAVISLYTSDGNIIVAGEKLLNNVPDLLHYYRNQDLLRLAFSLGIIALSIVVIVMRTKLSQGTTEKKKSNAPFGAALMLLSLSAITTLSTLLSTFYQNYGIRDLWGRSCAKSAFLNSFATITVIAFFLLLFLATFFTKQKRWIFSVPTTSSVLLLGFIAPLFARELLQEQKTPAEILPIATKFFPGIVFNYIAILIAIFFWFSAVSRNRIPLWLQIVLPTSLPIFFVLFETILRVTLNLPLEIPLGIPFISIITLILSLFVRTKKRETT